MSRARDAVGIGIGVGELARHVCFPMKGCRSLSDAMMRTTIATQSGIVLPNKTAEMSHNEQFVRFELEW
jgi:hypothetical protein